MGPAKSPGAWCCRAMGPRAPPSWWGEKWWGQKEKESVVFCWPGEGGEQIRWRFCGGMNPEELSCVASWRRGGGGHDIRAVGTGVVRIGGGLGPNMVPGGARLGGDGPTKGAGRLQTRSLGLRRQISRCYLSTDCIRDGGRDPLAAAWRLWNGNSTAKMRDSCGWSI